MGFWSLSSIFIDYTYDINTVITYVILMSGYFPLYFERRHGNYAYSRSSYLVLIITCCLPGSYSVPNVKLFSFENCELCLDYYDRSSGLLFTRTLGLFMFKFKTKFYMKSTVWDILQGVFDGLIGTEGKIIVVFHNPTWYFLTVKPLSL